MPPTAIEQVVELGSEGGKDALDAALEHKEEQGFGFPGDLEPANDIHGTRVPSCNVGTFGLNFTERFSSCESYGSDDGGYGCSPPSPYNLDNARGV